MITYRNTPLHNSIPPLVSAIFFIILSLTLVGCSSTPSDSYDSDSICDEPLTVISDPTHLPELDMIEVAQSEYVCIDYSNADNGYIMVQYLGSHEGTVKFQITDPTERTYTYNLAVDDDFQTFPLTGGDGTYTLNTFEQTTGTSYYTVDSVNIDVTLISDSIPYLYPNQFIDYDADSLVVDLSAQAAADVYSEIELIANVYNMTMEVLDYDDAKANETATSNLTDSVHNLDEIIVSGSGVCFDYAALMVAMLRIQEIPAKLIVGYAGDSYHAWINVYTEEQGWINEVITFNGEDWTLLDPTFADNTSNTKTLNSFIGNGSNYTEKYIY